MLLLLHDQTFVITGVTNEKSIAWGIAKSLHRQGAKLIFMYRKEKSLRKLLKLLSDHKINAIGVVPCDVTNDDSILSAFQQIEATAGKIDGLVHSVAFANLEELQGQFLDTTSEGYRIAHETSAYSLIALARHIKPLMIQGGSIVTQTYIGSQRVVHNYNVMGVAKAALEASVRYLAEDLGKYGIRVNAISSGPIPTSASIAIPGLTDKLEKISETAPLRRNIDQEEVGDATMFLLSHLSRGITGEIIHVDAGYHIIGT